MVSFRDEIATPAQKEAYIRTYMNVGYQVPKSSQIYRTAARELQRLAKGEIKAPKQEKYRAVKDTAEVKAQAKAAKAARAGRSTPPANPPATRANPVRGRAVVPGDVLEYTGTLWFSSHSRMRQIMKRVANDPLSYGIAPDSFSTYEQYLFEVWAHEYFGGAADQVSPFDHEPDDADWGEVHIRLL